MKSIKLTDLKPDIANANAGSERGLRALDDSIAQAGLGRSIVVDKDYNVIAGNKTLERAVDQGFEDAIVIATRGDKLVVVVREDLDLYDNDPNNRARKLAYADNRVAELDLSWDAEQLFADLQSGFNFDGLFDQKELDELFAEIEQPEPTPDAGAQVDRAEELQQKWQVERGQIWVIPSKHGNGDHRLMCGDSTDADDVGRLMSGNIIHGVITSPPYAEQRKNQYGGIPADEYVEWWHNIQSAIRNHADDKANFFINIKPHVDDYERSLYVFDLVIAMRREWGWMYIDEFCWLRPGVPKMVKYRFKNAFEPIYQFSLSKNFRFYPEAVQHDSYNVPMPKGEGAGNTNWAGWQGTASDAQGVTGSLFSDYETTASKAYPSNVLKAFSNDASRDHPAAFATQMVEFFLLGYSSDGDNWYEPFNGSGTTLVACEQSQRIGYGMEIAPEYCAVTLQRLADMGLEPRLS